MIKVAVVCLCIISFSSANGLLTHRKRSISIEDLNKGKKEFLYIKQISQYCKRQHPILEQVRDTFDLDLGQINLGSIAGLETMLIDFVNHKTQEWQTIELEDLLTDFAEYTNCSDPEITIFLDDNSLNLDLLPQTIAIGTMTFKLFSFMQSRDVLSSYAVRYELTHVHNKG